MRLIAGRFALVDPIGHGASGTVWRAFDQRNGKYCAVKVVKAGDSGWLLRVVREQGVRLTHPHVVCPYAWAADDDVLVAMDLVAGGSLATLISDHGALPDHYAARLLGQLLAALGHVHEEGLLHRDVKPANVLLEATGQGPPHCRLGDFGLALPRTGPRLTESGYVVGTPGYLAPEVMQGAAPGVGHDLYAVGVVGWQLLTGSERVPEFLVPSLSPPPGVAPGLWGFVLELLALEPHGRPPDAGSALRPLAEVARGLPGEQRALTRDGEPVEVFDIVGPLPDGWGPDGPGDATPATPGGSSAVLPPAPPPAAAGTEAAAVAGAEAAAGAGREAAGPAREDRRAAATPARAASGRRAPRAVVVTAAAVLVVAAAAVLLFLVDWSPAPAASPPATAPPVTTSPPGSAPATTAPPAAGPEPTRAPLADVAAGNLCGWQDVGSVETAVDGRRVRCDYDGRQYHWVPLP